MNFSALFLLGYFKAKSQCLRAYVLGSKASGLGFGALGLATLGLGLLRVQGLGFRDFRVLGGLFFYQGVCRAYSGFTCLQCLGLGPRV